MRNSKSKNAVIAMAKRRREREAKLLLELQSDHGYIMGNLPIKDRTGLMFNFKAQALRSVRCVRLSVPVDSALGIALAKEDKPAKPSRKVK